MSVRDQAPADAARRARQAAAAQSVDARLARTGSAAPAGGAQGRATQARECRELIRRYAPGWTAATLDTQATALWRAFMRARRRGWTTLPLAAWAPGFLRGGG